LSSDAPKENTIAMVQSQNIGTGSQECRDNIPMTRCEYHSQGSVRCNACKNQNIITMIKVNINLVLLIIIRTSIIIFSITITIITSHRITANGDHNVE